MNKYSFGDYTRVSKAAMQSVIKRNIEFIIIPCNGRLETPWGLGVAVKPDEMLKEYGTFNNFVNHFEYYNCNNELGNYAAFYVNRNDIKK